MATVFCLCLLAVHLARADTIVFGLPLEDVTVLQIQGGDIVFLHRGSQMTRSLEHVDAIYFADVPEVRQAEALRREGEVQEAIDAFEQALQTATKDLHLLWIYSRLAQAHSEALQPAQALANLARLALYDPSSYWFLLIPQVDEMSDLATEVDAARAAIEMVRKESLQRDAGPFLDALLGVLARVAIREPAEQPTEPDTPRAESDGAGAMPVRFPSVRAHLDAGRAREALRAIEHLSQRAERESLAELYFQAGEALRQLGQPAGAGLSYMRCAAHFPDTIWAGRAYLAVADIYVATFDNREIAQRLAQRALTIANELDDAPLRREIEEFIKRHGGSAPGDF